MPVLNIFFLNGDYEYGFKSNELDFKEINNRLIIGYGRESPNKEINKIFFKNGNGIKTININKIHDEL